MRSHELAPIFSIVAAMLFISSMFAEGIFAFIVITFHPPFFLNSCIGASSSSRYSSWF